jgi:septum formation inhibitor-activating ATPase MinD
MSTISIPDHITVVPVDTSTTAKTIQLPAVSLFAGRIITILDNTSNAQAKHVTITTHSGDVIKDDTSTSVALAKDNASITVMAILPNKWRVISYYNGGPIN